LSTTTVIQNWFQTSASTCVSAAFDIAVGDLILVIVGCDQVNDTATDDVTLTDNDADLAFTPGPARGATASGAGYIGMWRYQATRADTGVVVTITTDGTFNMQPWCKIVRVTGHDTTTPIGAVNQGSLTNDPQNASLTMQTPGDFHAAWTDWSATGVPVSSDLTETGRDDGFTAMGHGYKATSAGAQTGQMDSGAGPTGNWIAWEVRAITTSAALTGTAVGGITEGDIVAGGKTIVVTVTGDTLIPN
jgi:hypothetical protein